MTSQPRLGDDQRIVDVDIADRMERSFLDYAMSVIVGRALPDVRDGLKPVQRRILFAMLEGGLRPDRAHRKCAAAVGDTMRKYHPHGDSSIYEALVRMAQDFSFRVPLVDGHGNFGSVDGDAAAAMRYTEARLSPAATVLLADIEAETVDLAPNYDGHEQEPQVLPGRFPNLLVNGASGIAVGMATNIPPHALGETVAAARMLLARPRSTVDDLMTVLPGPDFPTGARIVAGPGIRDCYLTGRGAITMEAVATTETRSGGLPRIVVTELPYQVNKALLLERIADLVKARKVDAVRDLRDESNRDGMRVVIELKRGEDPARVLATLYRLTDLRKDFPANVVALVPTGPGRPPQPRTLGLVEILGHYLDHQRDVLTRRSRFRRDRAASRAHVLDGLLVALDAIDVVIRLIRAAPDVDAARAGLVDRFALSVEQASAILDMPLRRLAALERARLAEELEGLRALVAELEEVLGDPAALDRLLDRELADVAAAHADPRRSRIVTAADTTGASSVAGAATRAPDADVEVAVLDAQPVFHTVTAAGILRSVAARPASPVHGWPRDPLAAAVRATTEATLLLLHADGTATRVDLADVPVVSGRQRGIGVGQLTGRDPGAPTVGAVPLDAPWIVTVSAAGLVKRTERAAFQGRARTMVAAGVRAGDALVAVLACQDDDDLVVAGEGGRVIRFGVAEVRPSGRGATGVAGLAAGPVVSASVVGPGNADAPLAVLQRDGGALRAGVEDLPRQGRGGKGVRAGAGPLAWCGVAQRLHVPGADAATVLRVDALATTGRTGRAQPAVAAVHGVVVAETVGR